jgi:hypothetical protein
MTEREKIAARIRALLSKTVENGCTEAEAISAAEKVAEMLAAYNLTVDEVQMRASPFDRHTERHEDAVGERLWKVARAVAHLTGAQYWSSQSGVAPASIDFFGFAHEVDIAKYLLAVCARAMRQEHARLKRMNGLLTQAAQRRKIMPFLDGMADRLHDRIWALKPPAPTGKGLVVLHGQLITAAMADAGITIRDGRARASRDCEPGYADGLAAGDRVALNNAVTGPSERQRRLAG